MEHLWNTYGTFICSNTISWHLYSSNILRRSRGRAVARLRASDAFDAGNAAQAAVDAFDRRLQREASEPGLYKVTPT